MMTEEENNLVIEIGIKLMNFIGNSFDKANDITELKSVLEGLGFEDQGKRKLGGNNKGIEHDEDRCEKYSCKEKSKGKTINHRYLGGIYIFSTTGKANVAFNLKCFNKIWEARTTKNIPLVNQKCNEKYLYVGKDINNLNTRI